MFLLLTTVFSLLFFAVMFLCTYFSPALTRLMLPKALTSEPSAMFLKLFQRAVFAIGAGGILFLMIHLASYPGQITIVEASLILSAFSGMCLGTGLHIFRKKV